MYTQERPSMLVDIEAAKHAVNDLHFLENVRQINEVSFTIGTGSTGIASHKCAVAVLVRK